MYTKCNKCGAILSDPGTEFACPKCGNRMKSRTAFLDKLEAEEEVPPIAQYGEFTPFNMFRALTSGGCLLAIMSYCVFLVMCILVFFYAAPTVASHWQELEAIPFILIPYPAGLVVLKGHAAAAYWAFICIMMFGSLVWMVFPERKKLKLTFMDTLYMLRAPTRSNTRTFFMVAQLFLAILFFDIVYYMIIEAGGAATNVPPFEDYEAWENMYGFLNAAVWEEIVTRALLIGAPLLFFKAFVSAADGTLHEKTRDLRSTVKKVARLLAGGHGAFTPVTVGLIVFSSLMFGFAHAPGWDMWKVLPTAVSGLAFGYIYIKKGLHAGIVLHFSFNYLGLAEGMLPDSFGANTAMIIIIVLWVLAGFVYFVYYFAKVVRFFGEPERGWKRPVVRTLEWKVWKLLGYK